MKRTGLVALALTAAVAAGCNRSNSMPPAGGSAAPNATGTSGSAPRADVTFVADVSDLNNMEIDLSRLAVEHSTNPDVKKFAQMTIDDHTAAGNKLGTVVAQNAIEAKPPDADKARDERDTLAKKEGADFDRDYIEAMIDGHNKLIGKLESRLDKSGHGDTATVVPEKSDNATTQSLNQWAADTYPAAASHREQAKSLKESLKKH